MKMTCVCGSTTMEFPKLKREDFPADGWFTDCCKLSDEPICAPSEEPRSSVEAWLQSTDLMNKTRTGVWVSATRCYEHYVGWMMRMKFEPAVTMNKFGRLMGELTSSCRRNTGKHYLLEDYPK